MDPALWGVVTAVSWGGGDFIARFTGRAMGVSAALFGMLLVSAVALTLLVWRDIGDIVWDPTGGPLVLITGVGITSATLLMYWGLARGPVTVVAPITGSYPAFALVLAFVLGARPSLLQWLAMAVVMAGVVIVARISGDPEDGGTTAEYSPAHIRRSAGLALGAALIFAFTVIAAQNAARIYGQLPTLWMARWIGLACMLVLFVAIRAKPAVPVRWWPALALQGLLDSGAYVAMLLPAGRPGAEIAVVVASGFCAVTVLLARIFLKERMTWPQWAGIFLIVGGVAALSANI